MRCYDGCPDKQLQAKLDDESKAAQQLNKVGIHVTYFPMEGMWMGFDSSSFKPITGFHETKRSVANSVLARITP